MKILGIHCGYGSGSCLVDNGIIIADAQEERFVRLKNSKNFPSSSIKYCLHSGGINDVNDLDCIAIASRMINPYIISAFALPENAERAIIAESISNTWEQPNLVPASNKSNPIRAKPPLYVDSYKLLDYRKIKLISHHRGHAALAHFTRSSRETCLIFVIDSGGGGAYMSVWCAEGNNLQRLAMLGKDGSISNAFSLVGEALGWREIEKTMELSDYGNADKCTGVLDEYFPTIDGTDIKKPSSLHRAYYWFINNVSHDHFDEAALVQKLCDKFGRENIAAEAQRKVEDLVSKYVMNWIEKTGVRRCAFSGDLFENSKLNTHIWKKIGRHMLEHHVAPLVGDAGLSLGASMDLFYRSNPNYRGSIFKDLYLGPSYSNIDIKTEIEQRGLDYMSLENPAKAAAIILANGGIVGWFQGSMESGPCSLGNRAILTDPGTFSRRAFIAEYVKNDELFRPLPASLIDKYGYEYLSDFKSNRYANMYFKVNANYKERFSCCVDPSGSICINSLKRGENDPLYNLIQEFGNLTGIYLLAAVTMSVNETEPTARTPSDAIRIFYDSALDALILGDFLLLKEKYRQGLNPSLRF